MSPIGGPRDKAETDELRPRSRGASGRKGLFTFRPHQQKVGSIEPLIFFTDAILAIAATILAFQIKVPDQLSPHALGDVLTSQWKTFAIIFLGYLWLVAAWINTRRLHGMLRGVDHYATLIYLLMIFTVVMIPNVMLILSRTIFEPDFSLGVQLLAVLSLANGILVSALLHYAERRGLGVPSMDRSAWRQVLIPNDLLTAADVVAVVLAPFVPWLVLVFICADWLYSLLPLFADREAEGEGAPRVEAAEGSP